MQYLHVLSSAADNQSARLPPELGLRVAADSGRLTFDPQIIISLSLNIQTGNELGKCQKMIFFPIIEIAKMISEWKYMYIDEIRNLEYLHHILILNNCVFVLNVKAFM